MATEPSIEVIEENVTVRERTPGMAGSIAIIGAFDSETTALTVCANEDVAHQIFGTSTSATRGQFPGTDAITNLFYGASELLVVNTTTWTDAETPEPETTITTDKLNAALDKLEEEVFDLLFIAADLNDSNQTIVSTWLDKEFRKKYAHGQVSQVTRSTAAAYETAVACYGQHVYWITTQNYKAYNRNESAALMAGYIASLPVNTTLTHRIIPPVNAVSPEYSTKSGEIGAKLLELNVPFLKPRDRLRQDYYCVNSLLPDGLDLYINRVRDYIINRLEAELLLGQVIGPDDTDIAVLIVEDVKEECVDDLGLLEDIKYHVTKSSNNCIDIVLDKLLFNGVITKVNVIYSIEVQ